MTAYYNEHDPLKAEVIREAIKAGAVAPGDVDERSIKDVQPSDVMGYTQCHCFGGGALWSLALRNAGWPDTRPVWTGSCPCPSFSAAGKGGGFDDARHLWPDWFRLIRECRPATVFGEQVGAAVRYGWFDLVHAGLEAETYAVGAVVFGAHSVGAPHIRQRLYFVAHTDANGCNENAGHGIHNAQHNAESLSCAGDALNTEHAASDGRLEWRAEPGGRSVAGGRGPGECADTGCAERRAVEFAGHDGRHWANFGRDEALSPFRARRAVCECANTDGGQSGDGDLQRGWEHGLFAADRGAGECPDAEDAQRRRSSGEAHGGRRSAEVGGPSSSGDGLHPIGARPQGHAGDERAGRGPGWLTPEQARSVAQTGATRGFWAGCDWWYGRDGKYRPIGPGIFPLASKYPARVGILRMAGDAIVVEQAQTFIEAYLGAN